MSIDSLGLNAVVLGIAQSIHEGLGLRFPCNDLTLG